MSDMIDHDDLIRRGDARKVADEVFDRLEKKGADQAAFGAAEVCEAIAALPAQGVRLEVREAIAAICAEDDPFIGIGQSAYDKADRILAALAPASGGVEATEDVGILRARVDELQRLNADLTRQVQMQPRRPQDAAPATDAVDALVEAALEKAREILIKHGYPKGSILIGYLDAALAAIRENRNGGAKHE